MPDTFRGFGPQTLRFLRDLREHNDKAWFEAHREHYEGGLLEPSRAFVVEMGERLRTISPGLLAVPLVNGSIFKIHRDTRFSKDKTPFKSHLAIYFWEGSAQRIECPGFYLHLEPEKLMLGVGYYQFSKPALEAYRRAAVDPVLGPELARAVAAVRAWGGPGILAAAGCGGTIDHYKKLPAGLDPAHPNAEFLLYKGLHAGVSGAPPAEMAGPGFVDWCLERFRAMSPIHLWLVEALGA
jgi:uncharacterized protein (TIGR02453 family)